MGVTRGWAVRERIQGKGLKEVILYTGDSIDRIGRIGGLGGKPYRVKRGAYCKFVGVKVKVAKFHITFDEQIKAVKQLGFAFRCSP